MVRPALPLTQYLCHQWGGHDPIARALLGVIWNDLGTAGKSGAHPGDRALRTFFRAWNPTEERRESRTSHSGQAAQTLKVRVAPGQAGKEEHLGGPRAPQASWNPYLDPLAPAVRVQSPLGLTLKEQASRRSPKSSPRIGRVAPSAWSPSGTANLCWCPSTRCEMGHFTKDAKAATTQSQRPHQGYCVSKSPTHCCRQAELSHSVPHPPQQPGFHPPTRP